MKKILLVASAMAMGAALVKVILRRRSGKAHQSSNDGLQRSGHHRTNVFSSAKEYATR